MRVNAYAKYLAPGRVAAHPVALFFPHAMPMRVHSTHSTQPSVPADPDFIQVIQHYMIIPNISIMIILNLT